MGKTGNAAIGGTLSTMNEYATQAEVRRNARAQRRSRCSATAPSYFRSGRLGLAWHDRRSATRHCRRRHTIGANNISIKTDMVFNGYSAKMSSAALQVAFVARVPDAGLQWLAGIGGTAITGDNFRGYLNGNDLAYSKGSTIAVVFGYIGATARLGLQGSAAEDAAHAVRLLHLIRQHQLRRLHRNRRAVPGTVRRLYRRRRRHRGSAPMRATCFAPGRWLWGTVGMGASSRWRQEPRHFRHADRFVLDDRDLSISSANGLGRTHRRRPPADLEQRCRHGIGDGVTRAASAHDLCLAPWRHAGVTTDQLIQDPRRQRQVQKIVSCWHKADVRRASPNVRFRGRASASSRAPRHFSLARRLIVLRACRQPFFLGALQGAFGAGPRLAELGRLLRVALEHIRQRQRGIDLGNDAVDAGDLGPRRPRFSALAGCAFRSCCARACRGRCRVHCRRGRAIRAHAARRQHHAPVIVEVAIIGGDSLIGDHPQLIGAGLDQIAIMARP